MVLGNIPHKYSLRFELGNHTYTYKHKFVFSCSVFVDTSNKLKGLLASVIMRFAQQTAPIADHFRRCQTTKVLCPRRYNS